MCLRLLFAYSLRRTCIGESTAKEREIFSNSTAQLTSRVATSCCRSTADAATIRAASLQGTPIPRSPSRRRTVYDRAIARACQSSARSRCALAMTRVGARRPARADRCRRPARLPRQPRRRGALSRARRALSRASRNGPRSRTTRPPCAWTRPSMPHGWPAAACSSRRGGPREPLPDLDRFLAAQPDHADALVVRARARAAIGDASRTRATTTTVRSAWPPTPTGSSSAHASCAPRPAPPPPSTASTRASRGSARS